MGTLTYPYSLTAGQAENVNHLNSNLTAISNVLNGSVDADNITDGVVTDAKLTSPNNSLWRPLARANGHVTSATTAQIYLLSEGQTGLTNGFDMRGAEFPIITADTLGSVASKTAQMRLRVTGLTNAVAPTVSFTFGLHQVTSILGSGTLLVTVNATALTSSTAVLTTPAASSVVTATSSAFTPPASGGYMVCVTPSGSVAADAVAQFDVTVEGRHS